MPGMDGLAVLREARAQGITTPALFLTAKAEIEDRVTGLDAGADDYLPKPFEPDELICRVRAMMRRGGNYKPDVLSFGDLKLDTSSGELFCKDKSVRLSGREFRVMELFMLSPKQVFSAERIMERVWGYASDAEINVVWVHISNLRKKMNAVNSAVTIRANRGLGYVLEENNDKETT